MKTSSLSGTKALRLLQSRIGKTTYIALIIPLVLFVVLGYRVEKAGDTGPSSYQNLFYPR